MAAMGNKGMLGNNGVWRGKWKCRQDQKLNINKLIWNACKLTEGLQMILLPNETIFPSTFQAQKQVQDHSKYMQRWLEKRRFGDNLAETKKKDG